MCGAMVGCVVCEGYAFFIKNARLLNLLFVPKRTINPELRSQIMKMKNRFIFRLK